MAVRFWSGGVSTSPIWQERREGSLLYNAEIFFFLGSPYPLEHNTQLLPFYNVLVPPYTFMMSDFSVNPNCPGLVDSPRMMRLGVTPAYLKTVGWSYTFTTGIWAMFGVTRIVETKEVVGEAPLVLQEWSRLESSNPGTLLAYSGLKYSVCTGNAERVRLWDLLKLIDYYLENPSSALPSTYDDFLNAFENSHAEQFRLWQIIHSRLNTLAMTGPQPWGELAVWWPDATGMPPQGIMVRQNNAPWIKFLEVSNCPTFAVVTTECLEYETKWNRLPQLDLYYGCGGNYDEKSVLHTKLAVFVDMEPGVYEASVAQMGRSQKLVFESTGFVGHLQALTLKHKRHPQLFGFVRYYSWMRWWARVFMEIVTKDRVLKELVVDVDETDEMVIDACISNIWMIG